MKTVLYDFKRSFFRLSVLLFIIIFALAGIGLSYLVANTIFSQVTNISVIGVATNTGNNTIKIIGVVLDKNGNSISNAEVYILSNKTTIASTTTNSSGYFTLTLTPQINLEINIKSNEGNTSINIPQFINIPQSSAVFMKPSSFVYGSLGSPVPYPSSVQVSVSSSQVGAILTNINKYTKTGTLVIAMTEPNYDVYYTTTSPTTRGGLTAMPVPSNLTYNYLGKVTDYISIFNININFSDNYLALKLQYKNSTNYLAFSYSLTSIAESRIVTSTISSLGPFAEFFPVIFLYLVYAMVAKPRSTGALEFLLARPVTRREIYINRYIAGILTAFTASGILIITTYISMNILIGKTLDAYSFLLLYIGISGSLIAFFSLMYSISTFLRSALYLGLSIGLYMLLYMFWNVFVILYTFTTQSNLYDILYLTYYFNPNGLYNFITYFIQDNYGVMLTKTTVINNIAIIASSLAWIIVPTILGYLKFKKINLSS